MHNYDNFNINNSGNNINKNKMETIFRLNLVDANSVASSFINPKKTWTELVNSLTVIKTNFERSEIKAEELETILKHDERNKNSVPDEASIQLLIETINRYIDEYKIPKATTIFLEFSRHAAIYLFSINAREKAINILKEILNIINEANDLTVKNEDINLICVKDCVKVNLAAIKFWCEDFVESKKYLQEVITYYETSEDDLYLIKMVNFVSVAFTYLAWVYSIEENFIDAEKAFLHSLKVISVIKKHSKEKLQDKEFIETNSKRIFIYGIYTSFYIYANY